MIIPLKCNENNKYNTYYTNIEIDETNIPILDIGDRFGPTDYIDFIQWNEVTSPVMCGIDKDSRKFLVIKFIVNGTMKFMQTFFQRYTNCNYNWQGCGHATPTLFETSGTGITDEQWRLIKDVVEGNHVKIKEAHRFALDYELKHKDYTVELYDEKKEAATKIIQKYWRLCRYNPKYKMCEKVQTNNLEEIISSHQLA